MGPWNRWLDGPTIVKTIRDLTLSMKAKATFPGRVRQIVILVVGPEPNGNGGSIGVW
ncbi:hypothetical protein RCH09_003746 [Actimicrobium sp. GrIS 1.19]|nr:hypothetical protein [Actimicrobium sp. GrIS 1.19]